MAVVTWPGLASFIVARVPILPCIRIAAVFAGRSSRGAWASPRSTCSCARPIATVLAPGASWPEPRACGIVAEGATPAGAPASPLAVRLRPLLEDVGTYSRLLLPAYRLRTYQIGPARSIAESITERLGRQFAVVFSRQAGKDETLAQLIAWLLTRYQVAGGTIVVAAPTRTPQANITRDRVLDRLKRSALTVGRVRAREGYIVEVGQASARFLSADEGANPRGQTASLLLVANEAQDIDPAIWDARFDPMAAATNATTVFMGTVWDRNGLLHRQIEHLASLEGVPTSPQGESLRSGGKGGDEER